MSARLVEAVLRDARAVLPVAAYSPQHKVTLSLSSVLGAGGVQQMHGEERQALTQSAPILREAAEQAVATGTE
ncbi:hypothetical protein AB0K74_41190 [Streptomyces sp. NPDC056159]|uniref:hypothetical protein n=1 Tax=Streptomyces sp. NPDC056159 TaxID=3155537 RepID=UPI00341500CD